MGILKNIQWSEITSTIGEWILIVLSMVIWLPVTCFKFGLVVSDNIIEKYVTKK